MMNFAELKSFWESDCKSGAAKLNAVNNIRHLMGLCDEKGHDYKDHVGNRVIRNQKMKAEEFSLAGLGEAICGYEGFRKAFNPENNMLSARQTLLSSFVESQNPGDRAALFESTGVGLDPSGFQNINAYTILTSGLMEIKVLEAFQNPAYIADTIMPSEATKLNGQKVIGLNPLYTDSIMRRQPGQTHARTGFGERWIQTPETRENALAIDVTKEVIFFDRTGDLLNNAKEIGDILAYNREVEMLDVILGITNTNIFNWKGTYYNTYDTSTRLGQTNGNDITNDMQDWTAFQTAWLTLSRFTDPDTSRRILINPNKVIVSPGKIKTAEMILGSTRTERRYGSGATTPQTTSNPLYVGEVPGNPFAGQYELVTSPIIEDRWVNGNSDSVTTATGRWIMLDTSKAFKYMVNYPLQVVSASPQSYSMVDKGIAMSFFAHERGIPSVWSIWHTLRCSA